MKELSINMKENISGKHICAFGVIRTRLGIAPCAAIDISGGGGYKLKRSLDS